MGSVIESVCQEMFQLSSSWFAKRPAVAALAAVLGVTVIFRVLWLVVSVLSWDQTTDPNAYREVYGRVCYDDGSKIPSPSLFLSFTPDSEPSSSSGGLRTSAVRVDSQTGKFAAKLSYRKDISSKVSRYRVCVFEAPQLSLAEELASPVYSNPDETPIRVDIENQPLEIKLSRPAQPR
jgi:hypothetical protein